MFLKCYIVPRVLAHRLRAHTRHFIALRRRLPLRSPQGRRESHFNSTLCSVFIISRVAVFSCSSPEQRNDQAWDGTTFTKNADRLPDTKGPQRENQQFAHRLHSEHTGAGRGFHRDVDGLLSEVFLDLTIRSSICSYRVITFCLG
jgi:hypothetical protein